MSFAKKTSSKTFSPAAGEKGRGSGESLVRDTNQGLSGEVGKGTVTGQRFNELFEKHGEKLYNFALWTVRNREAAEDIIQMVFSKLWKQVHLPGTEKEIEAWLYQVTRNQCMDFFRNRARSSRFRMNYGKEASAGASATAESKFVWDALDFLDETDRSVLYLHFRTGYSYKEIAEKMDSTENAVRVRAFRALQKIRKRYIREEL